MNEQNKVFDCLAFFSSTNDCTGALGEVAVKLKRVTTQSRPDFICVLFNFEDTGDEVVQENIIRFFHPHKYIGIRCEKIIFETTVKQYGAAIVAFYGANVSVGGICTNREIRESTEKYLWKITQENKTFKKMFIGVASLENEQIIDCVKGTEVSVGRKSPLINLFYDTHVTGKGSKILTGEDNIEKGMAGVFFHEPFQCSIKSGSGLSPLGKPGFVKTTETKRNIISTIDGEPAVEFYEKYFGAKIKEDESYAQKVFSRYPLGIQKNEYHYDIYMPLAVKQNGELELFSEVQDETNIRMMIPTREGLFTDLRSAALQLSRFSTQYPVLFFEGYERYKFFGAQYDRALKALKDQLPNQTVVGGVFYALSFVYDSDIFDLGHGLGAHHFTMATFKA